MKRNFVLLLATLLFLTACQHDGITERHASKILSYASCKMDIRTKNGQSKGIDIIGDSAKVHELSRYMGVIRMKRMPPDGYDSWDEILDPNLPGFQYYWDFWCQEGAFDHNLAHYRDTIEHTFIFTNDEIIMWAEHDTDENGDLIGVDGTEYLGPLVHHRDIVFCVCYADSAKTIRLDPFDKQINSYYPYYFDTLGYLPNAQQEKNESILKEMLAERRYQDILDFFKSSYHIYICTGEEYRELARQGLN